MASLQPQPGIGTHEIQGDLVGGDLKELFEKRKTPLSSDSLPF